MYEVGERVPYVSGLFGCIVSIYIWARTSSTHSTPTRKPPTRSAPVSMEKDAHRRVGLAIELVDDPIKMGVPGDTTISSIRATVRFSGIPTRLSVLATVSPGTSQVLFDTGTC